MQRSEPPEPHENPFEGLRPTQIHALLTDPDSDLPTWPEDKIQTGYGSAKGRGAIKRTQYFIDMLERDGAFVPGWRALDYGAGWGRIASLMLQKGRANQLDLVDALDKTMRILENRGLNNRMWKVSESVRPGEIPEGEYDFVYAFSIFTHLPPPIFANNLNHLLKSVRSASSSPEGSRGGTVYFTRRVPSFVDHKYADDPDTREKALASLAEEGHWFVPQTNWHGSNPDFGLMVVTDEFLHQVAGGRQLDYLGQVQGQMQHLYALRA
jgi:hypothetical protein